MEAYLITDAQNLIVRCQYLNNNWTVVYITDSENGHLYYPTTGKDAYNYTTGELIKQEETTEPAAVEDTQEESKEPETQEVPHRDGMYGISDKSCHDIDATFSRDKVRNDVTGECLPFLRMCRWWNTQKITTNGNLRTMMRFTAL